MQPYNAQRVFVDATDGKIIQDNPLIINANAPGTAQTLYNNGIKNITCDSYSGGYRLRETRSTTSGKNVAVKTFVCASYPPSGEVDFSNTNTNWISGSWATFAQQQIALDVHWGTEKVLDYWSSVHSRNGIGGAIPLDIKSYVSCVPGVYESAAWLCDDIYLCWFYGMANGMIFTSFAALDIVAHEMGHGIAQFTSDFSEIGESGALGEGFSDIWSACVKYWVDPNKSIWLFGNEIMSPSSPYNCIRNMQNPKSNLAQQGCCPNTYKGQCWDYVQTFPHTNSTVLSHWFYLLCQGGSGTNDLGNAYNVVGIGINKAQHIAYKTLLDLDPAADYSAACDASIQAAINLGYSCEVLSVIDAWNAVGVENGYSTPFAITSSTNWNNSHFLATCVTVETGATLTITGTVNCTDNASIIVQPGGKLVVDGGKLTACSNTMWQGIIVQGNSSQPQTAQNQGTVELKNSAIIEHALCAINATSGGIITATNTTFQNNLQAIKYDPYENYSGGTIADNKGKFTKCTFTIDPYNRFSANGKIFNYHVYAKEVRGIIFEGCTFTHTATTGTKGAGIYTMDAGFKVINYCGPYAPHSTNIDCACPSGYHTPTTFRNHAYGIYSNSTGTPRSIYIDQSEFQFVTEGARLSAQGNYRLTRCTFANIKTYALYSAHSSGYRIEENDFSALNYSGTCGIVMCNSGIASNRIYKNSFNGFSRGIDVQGTNGVGNSRSNGTPPGNDIAPNGLQFICNDFTNNQYDIHISSNGTVCPYQGSLSAGADNRFSGTVLSSFASFGTQAITYYRRPIIALPDLYEPYNPTSNITINRTATPNPCDSTFCLPNGGGGGNRSDTDSLEQYKSMQAQYDKLLAQLKDNPELLQELLFLSDAMRELSDHAISRILQDSILYLDALKSWYEVVRTPIVKYWLSEVYASEKKYEQAEAILREIPAKFAFSESELIEHENYMRFYNFKKQMLLSGKNWMQLDEAEIAQLQRIAEATNGRSAGMAKGVLCFFYDICYEDKIEEGDEGESGVPPKNAEVESPTSGIQNSYELSIYPNPTQSEIAVATNNPTVKIIQTEIYDFTNRKVHQQTVNQSYSTLKLNDLAQGVYVLKVWLDNGDMVIRKVVKQ